MNTTFNGRLHHKKEDPTDWSNLTILPNVRMAFIYERLSTHEQIKKSIYSIKAQDSLVDLAKEDGYLDSQIYVEKRDLGISGTKGREDREGLAHLIEQVEADLVEAVYVIHISRLYRDQTLINAFSLGELFKQHNVIVVTPHLRLNLTDKMHMRLFRMEVERAADELELMVQRLHGAKNLKAKAGYYAGQIVAAGYVVDERRTLENGQPNPDFHIYQIYEPHAVIIKTIFAQLLLPKMTPTRVARYCRDHDLGFAPFPPEFSTKANLKGWSRGVCNPDGTQKVSVSRVRSIATNPAYIGWKIWEGQVVSKDAYPPIIDEATFWGVQERFGKCPRPKKNHDPLPLAGLLYCHNHQVSERMTYANKPGSPYYECCERVLGEYCTNISAHILDGPICEAVVGQISLPTLAEQILIELTSEYEQAKEQAASFRREIKRLESEIKNLRANLATSILSASQMAWIDEQIESRLMRAIELADLQKQPLGAIGQPSPGQADIELVKSFLGNLSATWANQPNGLKNALLRILLDKVVISHNPAEIRAKINWRVDLEQEILIHRPQTHFRPTWTKAELEILHQHYPTASKDDLLAKLQGRLWTAIVCKAVTLKIPRTVKNHRRGPRYTPEEDKIVRKYYSGEISREEVTGLTGRTIESIWSRGSRLGLKKPKGETSWEWTDKGCIPESEPSS